MEQQDTVLDKTGVAEDAFDQAIDNDQAAQDQPNQDSERQEHPDGEQRGGPQGEDSRQGGQSPREHDSRRDEDSQRRSRSRDGSQRENGDDAHDRRDARDANPDTFTQVYISRLGRRTGERDIEDAFTKFGTIRKITMKQYFAFVDYEDHSSAVDAIKELNQTMFNGECIIVQQSMPQGARDDRREGRRGGPTNDSCFKCGRPGHWQYECNAGGSGGDRGRSDRGPARRGGYRDHPRDRDDRRPRRFEDGDRDRTRRFDNRRSRSNDRNYDRRPPMNFRDNENRRSRSRSQDRGMNRYENPRNHRDNYNDRRQDNSQDRERRPYARGEGGRDYQSSPPRHFGGHDGGSMRHDDRDDRRRNGDGGGDRHYNGGHNEERSRIIRDGLCYNCKKKGHKAMDCPEGGRRRGGGGYDRGGYRRGGGRMDMRRERSPPARQMDDRDMSANGGYMQRMD